MQLNGDVIAAYLSSYGGVEDYTQIKSAHGTAYSDFTFPMILDRGGFNAIPHTISYWDTMMTIIVEGRKPLCWNCKQLGHFLRSCPQKDTIATNKMTANDTTNTTNYTTNTTVKTTTTTTAAKEKANTDTGVQPHKEEGWTLVKVGKKKKSSPTKTTEAIPTTTSTTTIALDTTIAAPVTTQTPIKKKKKVKKQKRWKHLLIKKGEETVGIQTRMGRKNSVH